MQRERSFAPSLFLKVAAPTSANRRVVRLPGTKNGGGALLHRGVLDPADVVKDAIVVLMQQNCYDHVGSKLINFQPKLSHESHQ